MAHLCGYEFMGLVLAKNVIMENVVNEEEENIDTGVVDAVVLDLDFASKFFEIYPDFDFVKFGNDFEYRKTDFLKSVFFVF